MQALGREDNQAAMNGHRTEHGVIYQGECLQVLRSLPDESVHCCVTNPPYYRLRSYGIGAENGEIGQERTPEEYISKLVEIFREVRRVLRSDGTCWTNIGDSYNAAGRKGHEGTRIGRKQGTNRASAAGDDLSRATAPGLKPKDLIGIPWMLAFALRADGWYLRSEVIWEKINCMPESVKDRPTQSHEHVFLFSKSQRYYYDQEAVKVPASPDSHARYARGRGNSHKWADGGPGDQTIARSFEHMCRKPGVTPKSAPAGSGIKANTSFHAAICDTVEMRNLRTVWSIPTQAVREAHFATYPEALAGPCILAGCPEGGTVLDPFFGAGTTGVVCVKEGRRYAGIELNPKYIVDIAQKRIAEAIWKKAAESVRQLPLPLEVKPVKKQAPEQAPLLEHLFTLEATS